MQQSLSPIVRQNIFTGKREKEYRNIRAKNTGTPQIIPNNTFLKEKFAAIPLTDTITLSDFEKIVTPQKNMERLIKAASGYLALYEKELSFIPSGKFGRDMTDLIRAVTSLLPEGQSLNVDYMNDEYMFIAYQANPKLYWDTIIYIPVSIAHTMRSKIRKLFIRFIAFIMQQNNLPTIQDTYDYDFHIDYIQEKMREKDEEVDESYIETMRSYKNKKGRANKMLRQIEQCKDPRPSELLEELKNIRNISIHESEQVQCMIRGLELLSRGTLSEYVYDSDYDDYTNEYLDDDDDKIVWKDLICISWGTYRDDALIDLHFEGLSDRCNNYCVIEPYSAIILSPEELKKLPPCTFPFEWSNYICDDFYKHLTTNE